MADRRLEKWEKQKAALEERIRLARSRDKERERKVDNKRKFLLGAMLMEWMDENPSIKKDAMERMKTFLTRASDRRYFGYAPIKKSGGRSAADSEAAGAHEADEGSETSAA